MIVGIGIDVIEIERIKKVFQNKSEKFLKKVFTDIELEYSFKMKNPYLHLAARFCSKEAYYKSIGEGVLIFNEIEVENGKNGKPFINLYGKTKDLWESIGYPKIHLSLSHTETVATAVVVLEK